MATTVRDTVTLALRKLGVLRSTGQASAADAESGRASLSSYYMECVTTGTFGRVANVVISSADTLTSGVNQHLNITTPDEVTVNLPATVEACYWSNYEPYGDYGWPWCNPVGSDGVTVPPDRSVIMLTDQYGSARATYIYDGTVQRWLRVDALTLNDEAPLSARNPDGLASMLAVRLSDEFGIDPRPATVLASNRYRLAMVHTYGDADRGCC